MPWGEMTITLDDITSLLGLPLQGKLFTPAPTLDYYECLDYGERLFGIPRDYSIKEFAGRTPAYRLRSLERFYNENLMYGRMDQAARCYILHLLGSTIICDTSKISIGAKWMRIVADFDSIGDWAWGTTCLAHIYAALNQAVYYDTKTVPGYLSVLQIWIYEHFPSLVERKHLDDVEPHLPRSCRWDFTQLHHLYLADFRARIDDLPIDEVIFEPYDDDRQHHRLHPMAFFRGWIPYADGAVRYMPDRVLWQFGKVQEIPIPPLVEQPTMRDILRQLRGWLSTSMSLRTRLTGIPHDMSFQMAHGYLTWFLSVTAPRLTQPGAQRSQPQPAQPQPQPHADDDPAQAHADDDPAQPQPDHVAPRRRRTRHVAARAKIQGAMDVIYTAPADALALLTGALADLDLPSD